MSTDEDGVVGRLRSEYGSALRAVATYDREGYILRYAREGIEANYSTEDMDAIYEDVVLQDVEQPFHEQLFEDMGPVRGKMRLFEYGTVAHFWPTEEDEGLFVAFDGSADPGVRGLLGIAREFYA